jgi:type IV pilus assembly protein PilB
MAVIGQRLLRRTCTHCAEEYEPPAEELTFYEDTIGRSKSAFVQGVGCNLCLHTGYQGRIGVYELLVATDEIRELIVQHAPHEKLHAMAVSQGMRTLREEAVHLVEQDITTIGEVIRRIYSA